MSRKKYHSRDVVATVIIVMVLGIAFVADAADPLADLSKGNSGFKMYSNVEGGPDKLRVKHDEKNLKATGPCNAKPRFIGTRQIEIKATGNTGNDILAAVAKWRKGGESVFYTVNGKFVEERGGKGEAKTWTAEYNAPEVEIINAPMFLYANATAWVPVQFRVKNFDKVKVQNINVFYKIAEIDSIKHRVNGLFAHGDGFGEQENGRHNIYTAWLPIDKFQISVPEDTIDKTRFQLTCEVAETETKHGKVQVITDFVNAKTPWYRTKIFGDSSINIVEIGLKKKWSAMDSCTKQTKMHKKAKFKSHRIKGSVVPVTEPQPIDHTKYNHFTTLELDEIDSSKTKGVHIDMEDKPGLFHPPADGDVIQLDAYKKTIGFYFGVSYPHKKANVLKKQKIKYGLDIHRTQGTGHLTAWNDGFLGYEMDTKGSSGDDVEKWIVKLGIKAAFAIGGSLASPGWGTAGGLAVGELIAESIVDAIDNDNPENSAEFIVYYIWCVTGHDGEDTPGWANGQEPDEVFAHDESEEKPGKPLHRCFNNPGFPINVGNTYTGHVTINGSATCKNVSSSFAHTRGRVTVIYKLIKNRFSTNGSLTMKSE